MSSGPVLHSESLAPASRELVRALAARPWAEEFYLAGSAALALHLGHRPVRDLDLMAGTNRLTGPERRDLLGDLLALDPGTRVETARDGYLFARAGSGAALRLFYYPYPLADPAEELDGLAVASPVDLGLMKLGAIISRGTRRDFVDLFLLCREVPLEALLERAADKFGHVRDFPLQALKGLADLSLVEGEPMPRLAQPLEWDEVEAWLREEVRRLGRTHVGLEA
ncbi:MAG TPA: nucleotidyl transferase AbiEii/AbiGii toxin family protein [Thermoanaerobaculia bacterium]|nr:nucleotidyl transferase AbiEii/AbiGii toxin family protein [Thermoanaerobaculia bacterium]